MNSNTEMTSLQRVLTALSFREADRVPFLFLLTTHGARALGMSIRDYFADAEAIAEAQHLMRQRYRHDCLYAFTYAALETEAWGAEVEYCDDGPPTAGSLVINRPHDIDRLSVPDILTTPCLARSVRAISLMKDRVKDDAPIIGVVMSPFSLPVMQMGFAGYLDLIHEDRTRFEQLMAVNQEFCVRWANAQLEAGATAICYFDPLGSTDMIPKALYQELAFPIACRVIGKIGGPVATHFASGRSLDLSDLVVRTQTVMVGISVADDLVEAKRLYRNKVTIFGNLDGISMRRWSEDDVAREVRNAIGAAAGGGGFVLSDNHGELHHSVDEVILDRIADAVHRWGHYPIRLPV